MNTDLEYRRKSYMHEGAIFFWTATIHQWFKLMNNDRYKDVVISSLRYLSDTGKIDVFAFVIMPNHIHLIWRINQPNGKETPQGSLLKYTAHAFKKMLQEDNPLGLTAYKVEASNKAFEFWQRDSLAVHLYTKKVAYQKLDYIHANPLAAHWQLAKDPCNYKYSSARYYEMNDKNYTFLKDLREVF